MRVQQVRLAGSHRLQFDESVVVEDAGEKDGSEKPSEKPAPAVAVESDGHDGHPSEAPIGPIVLSDKREAHDAEEYDERAAKFWSVYVEEAESHDKALVETWKDDMEGIIIFVRFPVLSLRLLSAQISLHLTGRFIFS
jgi:hypothetical protein